MLAAWRSEAGTGGRRRTSPRHGRHAGAAALIVIALAAAGCGGGSTKTATPPSTTSTTAQGGRNQAFSQCMKSHGVDVTGLRGIRGGGTTPSSLPAGVTVQQYQAALAACRSQLPAGGGQNFQNNPAFAAYRNCLQLHGVKLPQFGQGGGGAGQTPGSSTTPGSTTPGTPRGLGGLDTTNPTVQAALKACAALRPTGGPGQDGSTTTPTT